MVITICREYGSGGKYIGERLAQELNMKLYDKEILSRVSEESGIDLNILEQVDEKQEQSFWYTFATSLYETADSIDPMNQKLPSNEKLFIEQARVIENLADKEDCIIIGRCSNIILKNKPNVFNIFIYSSNLEFKIQRKIKYSNIKDRNEVEELINKTDLEREKYYNYFTGKKWGDREDYDIMIDTSKIGIDNTVELIKTYLNLKK
ncbi:MAG TPA: cytidylate kinase-like family protein [Candidatus Scatovivens faecipullorum]|nr:cytidylate kinase-like family protein [Candidatus Scatovivens faecipullorum]